MLIQLLHMFPVLGIVRLVTGPLGTGKSYFGVRTCVDALEANAMVVTNFDLVDDWTDQVARHGRLRRRNSRRVRRREEEFSKRYLRVYTMKELAELRVAPESRWSTELDPVPGVFTAQECLEKGVDFEDSRLVHSVPGEYPDDPGRYIIRRWQPKEGSVVIVLDESHRWMNARSWSKEGRGELLEFFALARKRGFVVYLLAQRAENLDVQVRELFEDHILLKNLRRSLRIFGVRVCPWNIFIAGWFNHAYDNECVRTDRYMLGWDRALYDTMDTVSFHEGDGVGSITYLPVEDSDDRSGDPPPVAPPPAARGPMPESRPPEGGAVLPDPEPVATLEGDPTAPVRLVDPASS